MTIKQLLLTSSPFACRAGMGWQIHTSTPVRLARKVLLPLRQTQIARCPPADICNQFFSFKDVTTKEHAPFAVLKNNWLCSSSHATPVTLLPSPSKEAMFSLVAASHSLAVPSSLRVTRLTHRQTPGPPPIHIYAIITTRAKLSQIPIFGQASPTSRSILPAEITR